MEYITHTPFVGCSICGNVNIPKGAKLEKRGDFLYYFNRKICSITSETAWEHFHENTPIAAEKKEMVLSLYDYILKGGEIDYPKDWLEKNNNHYWKNLIRTMPYDLLKSTYNKYILRK